MTTPTDLCTHARPDNPACIQCCLSDVLERADDVPASLRHDIGRVRERQVERGELLYREGAPTHGIIIINHGLVKLTQTLPNGQQRIVRLLHGGDMIGLESLVNHQARHTATAIVTTRVCDLPAALIAQLESVDPQVCARLMRQWQRSLDEADSFITQLSTGTAESRLARLLLKQSEGRAETAFPALSREEIGSIIGISTETASRMMARFKREGLIHERGDLISRCDVGALTRIAND